MHSLRRCGVAVRCIDNVIRCDVQAKLLCQHRDLLARSHQNWCQQSELRSFDRSPQRTFVAGMCNRRWSRRQGLATLDEALVLRMSPSHSKSPGCVDLQEPKHRTEKFSALAESWHGKFIGNLLKVTEWRRPLSLGRFGD